MAGKDLTVAIDYFFEGNYSERENTFIHALLDERNQFLEEIFSTSRAISSMVKLIILSNLVNVIRLYFPVGIGDSCTVR
jgi:hypothetical protein